MVRDPGSRGVWDERDEVLFSIEGGSQGFHAVEIIHWRFGEPANYLAHGGHSWDTSHQCQTPYFFTTYDIDAIEVPEPELGLVLVTGSGALAVGVRRTRRKAQRMSSALRTSHVAGKGDARGFPERRAGLPGVGPRQPTF